jgi:hypothetical protein
LKITFIYPRVSIENIISKIWLLSPFIAVFVSDILQFTQKDLSGNVKFLSFLLMLGVVVTKGKIYSKLILLTFIFLPIFLYHYFISFSIEAATEEGIRYFFPIMVLFYGYTLRKDFHVLLYFFLFFTIFNDLWQIINYINWTRGIDQWFYYRTKDGIVFYNKISGILRATGILGFFGTFGFLNLITFYLVKHYYSGKLKTWILTIIVVSLFLSFSYKAIGSFLIILFLTYKNKLKFVTTTACLLTLSFAVEPIKTLNFFENAVVRLKLYVFEGNSARAESYRVMFSKSGLLGRGVGSFGGPSSTKFNSPLYDEFNFNWFETGYLATTDTYFPHLFIEIGVIGTLVYLLIIISPILKRTFFKREWTMICIIYFSLFFDSLFSYSLNNLSYLILSLSLVYAISYFEKENYKQVLLKNQ